MKRSILGFILVGAVIIALLVGCSGKASSSKTAASSKTTTTNSGAGTASTKSSSSSSSSSKSSSSSFTNKYGTATTICAHSGCNNYIASSGDTNCCTTHSNKCLNCNKYIDEDALYCMSCLSNSISKGSSSSNSSSKSSSSSSSKNSSSSSSASSAGGSGKCKYKEGGKYVCTNSATNGNFCKKHYDYLNNAYNSLFGS